MGIAIALSFAKPHTVDDGSVIEGVGDDRVLLGEKGLKDPSIGIEGSSIKDRIVGPAEIGDLLLQLLVDVHGPTDETDGRKPVSAVVQFLLSRLDQFRV